MRTYGTLELTVSSPAQTFTEPLTVVDALKYLEINPAAKDIAMAQRFVTAARVTAEFEFGKDLVTKQYDLSLDSFCGEIQLRAPLQSVDLVEYRNSAGEVTALTEGTGYIVDTARSIVTLPYGSSWPSFTAHPSSAVLVRFTSGYSRTHPFWQNEGQNIRLGMMMLISSWFEERLPFLDSRGVLELPFAVSVLLRGTPRAR